jgi:hypothetical protein
VSSLDFIQRFKGLYGRYIRLRKSWEKKELKYLKRTSLSAGESKIAIELLKRGISFITQKTFPGLKNKGFLKFDFYLPKYNILLEHHGSGHFGSGIYYTKDLIENDKKKYKYAKDNGIKILYYTIFKRDYKDLGYFTEVITDIDELIKEIDSNIKVLDNSSEIISNYFKDDIVYLNQFLKERKVKSLRDFIKRYQYRYEKAKMWGILDKLTYYSEEQDLQEQQ